MIRVAHVVPSIENRASGPSYSVVELCRALAARGCDTSLYVLDQLPPGLPGNVEARRFDRWPVPYRLGVSPAMRDALRAAAPGLDIIHNHSLWMMPNIYFAGATRGTPCKRVLSPRGTMAAWAWRQSRRVKSLVWALGQRRAVAETDCFHATARPEYEEIRALGFRQPVAILPNGIHLPAPGPAPERAGPRTLLFVGRLHPKKGVDLLIRAWAAVRGRHPEWTLRIVGPDENGYKRELESLASRVGAERLAFAGPVFGAALDALYRGAGLFVLPTHSENFAMTVAESLAAGTPVLVSKGAPWGAVEREGCGWWIGIGEEPLARALDRSLALPASELAAMGQRGRAWMERDFSWDAIGGRMTSVYDWLAGRGDCPDCVEKG